MLIKEYVTNGQANEKALYAMCEAITSGDINTISFFHTFGVDINFTLPDNTTALLLAIEAEQVETFKYLVTIGATVTEEIKNELDTCIYLAGHALIDTPSYINKNRIIERYLALTAMQNYINNMQELTLPLF